ncbi:Tob1-like [Brachionus plicatilis]|uniref:Tob1-like n=1 Tax=Brachionus plicatilis TaxID=10195 RepID=A0A3M7T137_BRAPC|nr:Tob1-like [Brachionus plicatilis]
MFIEIKVVLNFLLSFLYDKLPRRRVNLFGDELEKQLKLRLSGTNWSSGELDDQVATILYESRSLCIDKKELMVDPVMAVAATDSAMDLKEILDCMPDYLKIFIEPGLTLYKLPQVKLNNLEYRRTEPEVVRESSESPVSSSSSLSGSSSHSASNADTVAFFDKNFLKPHPKVNSYFTPAEFAKTKFGSTKSKESFFSSPKPRTKAAQSSQNSEFAAYIKQKLQQQSMKQPGLDEIDSFLPQPQYSANMLLSNLTKSASYTPGFSPMSGTNFSDSSKNFDYLVTSTIQGMIDCYDDDNHDNF